jgi:arylsulfatase A-like enzyme
MKSENSAAAGIFPILFDIIVLSNAIALSELILNPLVFALADRHSVQSFSGLSAFFQALRSSSAWHNLIFFWLLGCLAGIIILMVWLLICRAKKSSDSKGLSVPGALLILGFSLALYFLQARHSGAGKGKVAEFFLLSGSGFVCWVVISIALRKKAGVCYSVISGTGCFMTIALARCLLVLYDVPVGPKVLAMILVFDALVLALSAWAGIFLDLKRSRSWSLGATVPSLALIFAGLLIVLQPCLAWLEYYFPATQARLNSRRPNVVMIVMDTVRADHLSLYGYDRETTPFLDQLGAKSAVFLHAYSTAPETLSSHASFFTGLLPSEHNCDYENMRLSSQFPTLAGRLRQMGYLTIGWSNNPLLNYSSGLARGFNRFVDNNQTSVYTGELAWSYYLRVRRQTGLDKGAGRTNKIVFQWLDRLAGRRKPFFLFINYMEAHAPYPETPEAYSFFLNAKAARKKYDRVDWDIFNCELQRQGQAKGWAKYVAINRYDGSIFYLDGKIGQLYAHLSKDGLAENSIIVVLSDHGESFGEHNFWGHGMDLYESELRVPLIIRYPQETAGARLTKPFSLKDLPGLLLNLVQGKPVKELLDQPGTPVDIFAEAAKPLYYMERFSRLCPSYDIFRLDTRKKALIRWPYKLVWVSNGTQELFQVDQDPDEQVNLAADNPDILGQMEASMNQFRATHPFASSPAKMDAATGNALKALGYAR